MRQRVLSLFIFCSIGLGMCLHLPSAMIITIKLRVRDDECKQTKGKKEREEKNAIQRGIVSFTT